MGGMFAHGSTIKVGDLIANLTNITGASVSSDITEVTNHDSEEGWRQFVRGLKDGGEINIEGNLIKGSEVQPLLSFQATGEAVPDCVIDIKGTEWTFDAVVKDLEMDFSHDDKRQFSAVLQVTGKPEETGFEEVVVGTSEFGTAEFGVGQFD